MDISVNPDISGTELYGADYYHHLTSPRMRILFELVALLPEGVISDQDRNDGEHATLL